MSPRRWMAAVFERLDDFFHHTFTLQWVPHDGRRPVTFEVSYLVLLFLGLLALFAAVGAFASYRAHRSLAHELDRVRAEDLAWRESSTSFETARRQENQWMRQSLEDLGKLAGLLGGNEGTIPASPRKTLERAVRQRLESDYGIAPTTQSAALVEVAVLRARLAEVRDAFAVTGALFEARHQFSRDIPTRWPLYDGGGARTSGFGPRYSPFEGEKRFHTGVDVAAPPYSPISVAADGWVEYSGLQPGYGWMVVVRHRYGWQSVYGHNAQNLVVAGQRVVRGERIALLGQSGRATGPHVHFEVRLGGQPVDPTPYLLADF